jgi:hypothetical protein
VTPVELMINQKKQANNNQKSQLPDIRGQIFIKHTNNIPDNKIKNSKLKASK